MKNQVKFLLYSDLHYDTMPDGEKRLTDIVQAVKDENVDFTICLGDIATPLEQNKNVPKLIESMGVPHYIALGNHDMDTVDKVTFMQFYGMDRSFYSVDLEDYHLIFLDTNFFKYNGIHYDYSHGNYYPYSREHISPEEISWFIDDVRATNKPCLLFSHVLLFQGNDLAGCGNYKEFHDIINMLNKEAGFQKVCASFNGHNHTSSYFLWDGVHHFDMTSAANMYVGYDSCKLLTPKPEYDEAIWRPLLECMMPYEKALYAIVTLDPNDNSLKIKGMECDFIGGSPEERGHSGTMLDIPITSRVRDENVILF